MFKKGFTISVLALAAAPSLAYGQGIPPAGVASKPSSISQAIGYPTPIATSKEACVSLSADQARIVEMAAQANSAQMDLLFTSFVDAAVKGKSDSVTVPMCGNPKGVMNPYDPGVETGDPKPHPCPPGWTNNACVNQGSNPFLYMHKCVVDAALAQLKAKCVSDNGGADKVSCKVNAPGIFNSYAIKCDADGKKLDPAQVTYTGTVECVCTPKEPPPTPTPKPPTPTPTPKPPTATPTPKPPTPTPTPKPPTATPTPKPPTSTPTPKPPTSTPTPKPPTSTPTPKPLTSMPSSTVNPVSGIKEVR